MVLRVPDQDTRMKDNVSALLIGRSERIGTFGERLAVFRCPINEKTDLVGFWVGIDETVASYLIVGPTQMGDYGFYEAAFAWTFGNSRRNGMHSTLLDFATREEMIISDRNGMTASAYSTWMGKAHPPVRWFDTKIAQFVDESDVPADQRFSPYSPAERWQLVIDCPSDSSADDRS